MIANHVMPGISFASGGDAVSVISVSLICKLYFTVIFPGYTLLLPVSNESCHEKTCVFHRSAAW